MTRPDVWTVKRMLEWATDFFESKGLESPRLLIEWLLSNELGLKRLDLYLNFDRPLSSQELDDLRPKVKEIALGKPLQYVMGFEQFFGLQIKTDSRALIPRPETEELVMQVVDYMSDEVAYRVLDIGTGTGCIPLAIKSKKEKSLCVGIDISEEAITLAMENAKELDLDVRFKVFDMQSLAQWPSAKKVDILISNPPYIHPSELNTVDLHVHQYEPHQALYTEDVPAIYASIAKWAEYILDLKGALFLELNPLNAEEIKQHFDSLFEQVELRDDLNAKTRFLCAFGRK